MRALVQRVSSASVTVGEEVTGAIGDGWCALVGVTHTDRLQEAEALATKLWHLRAFADAEGRMNVSLAERAAAGEPAEVLVVSQFTLYGDTRKGRRPSWVQAAAPDHAEPLIEALCDHLRALGATVATGRFRADMDVALVNDGPVTLLLEVEGPPG